MPRFITVTATDDTPTRVNVAHIVTYRAPHATDEFGQLAGSIIALAGHKSVYYLVETPQQIDALVAAGNPTRYPRWSGME